MALMILKLSNLICLLFIMLFISICFYVVPSSDDYCYSAGALENGFLGNIWWNYIHWSGRLSSTALIQIPLYLHKIFPLSFIEAYKIYCIIIILVCSVGVFIIFHISDFSDRNFDNIFPFLLTFATAIAIAVSPRDLFFWVPGSVTYMIPGVLYLCIISGLSNIVFTQKSFLARTSAYFVGCVFLHRCPTSLPALPYF
jgi:hypothetical protein